MLGGTRGLGVEVRLASEENELWRGGLVEEEGMGAWIVGDTVDCEGPADNRNLFAGWSSR